VSFLNDEDRRFLEIVAEINYVNPFLPKRIELEREALGPDFDESNANWNLLGDDPEVIQVNTIKILDKAYRLAAILRGRLLKGKKAGEKELILYEDAALFVIYHTFVQKFKKIILSPKKGQSHEYFTEFHRFWNSLFHIPGVTLSKKESATHMFACFFQIRRAFYYIFRVIMGRSAVAADLRARVWTSIFSHDMRRYHRSYYKRMNDFTTLILGPTGSGKELVARAIGYSRYIPFNPKTLTFENDFFDTFFPINLSAMPATLVESELFGHRRGAFTGAVKDRKGRLEICPEAGSVFLDEIGELDPLVQVKLLRVIQERTFQPLGDTKAFAFKGKIVAATHRDIHNAMENGAFREDFYYRLCSDIITTPSLFRQISESPDVLWDLVKYISFQVAGEEAGSLAVEVGDVIRNRLGTSYHWPGNIRELEQCVRNVMIHREYTPTPGPGTLSNNTLASEFSKGAMSMVDLCRRYATHVYSLTGSYAKTASRLKVDRRTVKKYVDEAMKDPGAEE
jgi:transcriptional regulator of aromatic amino acid metabolism